MYKNIDNLRTFIGLMRATEQEGIFYDVLSSYLRKGDASGFPSEIRKYLEKVDLSELNDDIKICLIDSAISRYHYPNDTVYFDNDIPAIINIWAEEKALGKSIYESATLNISKEECMIYPGRLAIYAESLRKFAYVDKFKAKVYYEKIEDNFDSLYKFILRDANLSQWITKNLVQNINPDFVADNESTKKVLQFLEEQKQSILAKNSKSK